MKDAHQHIQSYLYDSAETLQTMRIDHALIKEIQNAASYMSAVLGKGNKIISCGNGGSMADAMHFASELTGRYKDPRAPLAAMALSDPCAMSCIGNDFGYELVFNRQIRALGNIGDALLAISTSGQSKNIHEAISAAAQRGMLIIVLTGNRGVTDLVSMKHAIEIKVPSANTAIIQQCHTAIIHILVELIEQAL